MRTNQSQCLEHHFYFVHCLTRVPGILILQALEKKYDTLRDKLLLESLKKQLGAAEWAMLSEQERQKKLLALKREERRLRKEG